MPQGAARGTTYLTSGVYESDYFGLDGRGYSRLLLSWVAGQAGLLWGMSPDVSQLFGLSLSDLCETHGSYGHSVEHDLAELLAEIFKPYLTIPAAGVRFFQNGGDACAAAARLARAWTGRQTIATQGYHGAQLDFAHLPQVAGQEFAMTRHEQFDFGDVERMRLVAQHAACLMVEVPSIEDDRAVTCFLQECRATADAEHIPLIIDDVVGGFRFALGGTCERYGVQADLICLGKALSALGGVSALVGAQDVMQQLGETVFYSTTFGGSPGLLRVALETVRWLHRHPALVYGPDGHLPRIGNLLKAGLREAGVPVVGQPERSALDFPSDELWLEFCRRMIGRGVMMHRPNFVTLAHTEEHVQTTVDAARAVMEELAHG